MTPQHKKLKKTCESARVSLHAYAKHEIIKFEIFFSARAQLRATKRRRNNAHVFQPRHSIICALLALNIKIIITLAPRPNSIFMSREMHFAYDLSECFFFAQVGRTKISKKRIPHKQVLKQSLYDYRRKKALQDINAGTNYQTQSNSYSKLPTKKKCKFSYLFSV